MRTFGNQTIWGFKDPRTIRILPFWQPVFAALRAGDAYVVAVRHPRSVAASLFARQRMSEDVAYLLWSQYMIRFLHALLAKPMVVVDYDCVMREPRAQLERIADRLRLPAHDSGDLDRFAAEFLDEGLRHTAFEPDETLGDSPVAQLTKDAYSQLFAVATDRRAPYAGAFWREWEALGERLTRLPRCDKKMT